MNGVAHADSPLSVGSIAQVTVSLLLIVALIFAISWALRRLRPGSRAGRGRIGVIDELAVGPRERVVLVRVGDAQVLIGVGAGGIVGLTPLSSPIAVAPQDADPGFAARLREFLARGSGPA